MNAIFTTEAQRPRRGVSFDPIGHRLREPLARRGDGDWIKNASPLGDHLVEGVSLPVNRQLLIHQKMNHPGSQCLERVPLLRDEWVVNRYKDCDYNRQID
jgi:hypothetical protein